MYRADYHGTYRVQMVSGLCTGITAGAAAYIGSMRWASTTKLARIRSLEVECIITTAYGAAQEHGFDVILGRQFSVAHTGGTSHVPTFDDSAKVSRSAVTPPSQFRSSGDIRVASTAALGGGTVTRDDFPIWRGSFWAGAIGAREYWLRDFLADSNTDERGGPVILSADEGILWRNAVAMGATGVCKWFLAVEWDEFLIV